MSQCEAGRQAVYLERGYIPALLAQAAIKEAGKDGKAWHDGPAVAAALEHYDRAQAMWV